MIATILAAVADALEVDPALAARLARALGLVPSSQSDEPILLSRVNDHGAPSPEWVRDRARKGQIQIHGPRGGRFVLAADLRALLAATTIARRQKPNTNTNSDDARDAVVDLAARRSRRAG